MKLQNFVATAIREFLNEQQIQNNLNGNFKNWFNGSVMSDNGKPTVFYHGTKSNFDSFSDSKKGSNTDKGLRGRGFYFSTNINSSKSYGDVLLQAYLKILKPIDLLSFNSLEELSDFLEVDVSILHERGRDTAYHSIKVYPDFSGLFSSSIIEKGFDGIIHGQEVVVFKPNQIKSVENDGTWDINNDNIYS